MKVFVVVDQDTGEYGCGGRGTYGHFVKDIESAAHYRAKGPAMTFINQHLSIPDAGDYRSARKRKNLAVLEFLVLMNPVATHLPKKAH